MKPKRSLPPRGPSSLLIPLALTLLVFSPAPASELLDAIRRDDAGAVRKAIAAGADVRQADPSDGPPLLTAALQADAAILELLLDAGADVNATSPGGATALHYAATDPGKAEVLLNHHAKADVRSHRGNSPLHLAARHPGSAATVRRLLELGANPNATNVFGTTPLMAAAAAEDPESVRLLLDHGAEVNAVPAMSAAGFIWGGGRSALMWAAFRGNLPLLRLLLEHGARVDVFSVIGGPLCQAACGEQTAAARELLAAGAPVDQRDIIANYTPLHWAASSDHADPSLVDLLIAHHADVNAEGGQGVDNFLGVPRTPLLLARARGETPIVRSLLKAGARERPAPGATRTRPPARPPVRDPGDATLVEAVRTAIPHLERSSRESAATFVRHASGQRCVSCHQQQLPLFAVELAHHRGLPIDNGNARLLRDMLLERDVRPGLDGNREALFHPEPATSIGYGSLALHAAGTVPGPESDATAHHLAVIQARDGHWGGNMPRPPLQYGDVAGTALAIHTLRFQALPAHAAVFTRQIHRAADWLAGLQPETNHDATYQLLGLAWADAPMARRRELADALVRQQRADGGWGQLAGLPTDALATGLSLYALMEGADLPVQHPAIRRGLAFLVNTQLEDGTWHVRSRTFTFQPPMQSDFPHGSDSWISSAATSWAVAALTTALPPQPTTPPPPPALAAAPALPRDATAERSVVPVPADAPPVDFARDVQPLLERSCLPCHGGGRPKGGFLVETREQLLRGGNRGEAAIVPGQPEHGALLAVVTDRVEDLEMPPIGRRDRFPALAPAEVSRVASWIRQGAPWPEGVQLKAPAPAGR